MTESECLSNTFGRVGCLPPNEEYHLLWVQEEYCPCIGGKWEHAWEWTNGTWVGGQSRQMSWVKAENVSKYEWVDDALSFELLSSWLRADVEQRMLYPVKSQVCEMG